MLQPRKGAASLKVRLFYSFLDPANRILLSEVPLIKTDRLVPEYISLVAKHHHMLSLTSRINGSRDAARFSNQGGQSVMRWA